MSLGYLSFDLVELSPSS
ncbi:hypothetical protein F383_38262 [Gossypium arboreum]|uniref:Uncharacterized protein n=1 Tax=Gossypium arboreum TaxID=29729 RepID=A0A0B0ME17_GOSAR|nr:hypothetical protein F383_38262 [Gossypium arboreum]